MVFSTKIDGILEINLSNVILKKVLGTFVESLKTAPNLTLSY